MKTILYLLFMVLGIAVGSAYLLDRFYFSHQAFIKRLWGEIFKLTALIRTIENLEKETGTRFMQSAEPLKRRREQLGNLINSLIDYHYPGQDDKEDEFVITNHYEARRF